MHIIAEQVEKRGRSRARPGWPASSVRRAPPLLRDVSHTGITAADPRETAGACRPNTSAAPASAGGQRPGRPPPRSDRDRRAGTSVCAAMAGASHAPPAHFKPRASIAGALAEANAPAVAPARISVALADAPVRVHHGRGAALVARSVGARGVAFGSDIHVGDAADAGLLAHEVTHVGEQAATGVRRVARSPDPTAAQLLEADVRQMTPSQRATAILRVEGYLAINPDDAAVRANLALLKAPDAPSQPSPTGAAPTPPAVMPFLSPEARQSEQHQHLNWAMSTAHWVEAAEILNGYNQQGIAAVLAEAQPWQIEGVYHGAMQIRGGYGRRSSWTLPCPTGAARRASTSPIWRRSTR